MTAQAKPSLAAAVPTREQRLNRLIAYARRLAREQNERDRLNPRPRVRDDYHDDENDCDKAYHGGWL